MNVFVSSVVRGFETYRAAAKKAVTLLGHQPVMSEEFAARPYSSQDACMTEVDQADVVVIVLGADFGFTTSSGESVTQQEFRRAVAGRKPVLAFLQEVSAEAHQDAFRREVSDYVDGLFRVTFSSERELSDGIVRGLNQLATTRKAVTESEFAERLRALQGHSHFGDWNHETRLELAFLPQPELAGSLRRVHGEHESFFLQLCKAGLSSMKDGYKDFDQGDVTGIDTKDVAWRYHDCGLTKLSVALTSATSNAAPFASYYVSPSRVREVAEAAFGLINQGKGGWFQLGLHGLSHKLFQEPPASHGNSITMSHQSVQDIEERTLLIPPSSAAYARWLDEALFRIGRKLTA
jgi:nucleoside 2-deoxyribosyltransferase